MPRPSAPPSNGPGAREDALRAAIVGYGLAGSGFHAPLIASTAGLEVGAIVTANPERTERARREHPEAEIMPDAERLFERASEHDLVVVATPNRAHETLARRSIDAGLPVVVDKPLAPTAQRARELVEHAEGRGVLLTVFLNRRWDSDQLTLARLIGEGRLGTVLRYESRFERWRPQLADGAWREQTPPEDGGGLLLDLGSHLIDQATVLFGPVSRIYAEIESRRGGASDDDVFVALQHASGTRSQLWASVFAAAPGPRLRVLGDRAAFIVDGLDGQEAALRAGERPGPGTGWGEEPPDRWGRLFLDESESEPVPSERGDWPRFYAGLERALRDGGPPPVDPSDAVAGLELLDAARRSAATGSVIEPQPT